MIFPIYVGVLMALLSASAIGGGGKAILLGWPPR